MDFPSQIFFNDINHAYRAAILKKNVLWLLISIMKRCAERYALQFCQTSSIENQMQKVQNYCCLTRRKEGVEAHSSWRYLV